VCRGGGEGEVWGHRRGVGLRQIKHRPPSPFTGKFGIAFGESNLSAPCTVPTPESMRNRMDSGHGSSRLQVDLIL
jgi:hypothetical protein